MPEDRGVGKKVGSWEDERLRLNQDRVQRTDNRGQKSED